MSTQEDIFKKDLHAWLVDGESLEYADFSGGKFIGAHLPKLNFTGASFQNADLRYANLAGAILEGANLENANLVGANFTGANLAGANLKNAKLDNANLLRANLREACFQNAIMRYASLRAADIFNTDFTGADLQWVNLGGTKNPLTATFNDADLRFARGEFTVLDAHEFQDVGAKIEDIMGVRRRVFDFFEVEKPGGLLAWINRFLKRPS